MSDETTPSAVESIDTEALQGKIQKLLKKQLMELAASLGIEFRGMSKANKGFLTASILRKVNSAEISVQEVETELSKEKYKTVEVKKVPPRLTKKDVGDFRNEVMRKLGKIGLDIESLNNEYKELCKKSDFQSEKLRILEKAHIFQDIPLQSLFSALRKFDFKFQRPDDFNDALRVITKGGIKLEDMVKIGNVVLTLDSLIRLARGFSWPEDLDYFYNVLKSETGKIRSGPDVDIPIHVVRNAVCVQMNLSAESFNQQLISCFKKGWLTLDFRSPIGEEEPEYLEIEDRKYYVIRSFRRI